MERARNRSIAGLSGSGLRIWGMLFLIIGIVGRSILQKRFLGVGEVSSEQLLEAMQNSQYTMIFATLALLLQAVETCAVPIFTFLLVKGFQHTSDIKMYFLRVAGVAVLSEIPYNLAMEGNLWDTSSRNPVFGMALGLILLYFYNRYKGKSVQNMLIKVVITAAAILWASILEIEFGVCLIIIIAVLWIFRDKNMVQNFAGAITTALCSAISPFFLASPMGFLVVHFYNEERGEGNRLVSYLFYPVILLVVGLAAQLIVW